MARYLLILMVVFLVGFNPCFADEGYSFEVKNGSLTDFFGWVGEQLGVTVVVGKGVDDSVPLNLSVRDLSRDQVISLAESVAQSYELSFSGSAGIYMLVPRTSRRDVLKSAPDSDAVNNDRARIPVSNMVLPHSSSNAVKMPENEKVVREATIYTVNRGDPDILLSDLGRLIGDKGYAFRIPYTQQVYVYTDKDSHDRVKRLLVASDVQPRQVYVEAYVIELFDGHSKFRKTLLQSISDNFSLGANATGISDVLSPIVDGLSVVARASSSLSALLTLGESNGASRVLSRPRFVVRDGSQVRFASGQQIPIRVSRVISAQEGVQDRIDRMQTGVTIDMSAKVRGKFVDAKLNFSVIGLSADSTGDNPVTDNRSVSTDLVLEDGKYMLVGGMRVDRDVSQRNRVPGLDFIPGMGDWLGSRENEQSSSEIYLLLRVSLGGYGKPGSVQPGAPADGRRAQRAEAGGWKPGALSQPVTGAVSPL